MKAAKVAISMHNETLAKVDRMVKRHVFPSRSAAIQTAVEEKLARMERRRLAEACRQLDSKEEQSLAEEGIGDLSQWPEY